MQLSHRGRVKTCPPVFFGEVMPERTMPFGKYKGDAISECPIDYLDWLIGQEWLNEDLKEEIEDYLRSCPEWHNLTN